MFCCQPHFAFDHLDHLDHLDHFDHFDHFDITYLRNATLTDTGGETKGSKDLKSSYAAKRKLVPTAGVEPAHLSIPDFESGASTNSARWAFFIVFAF